MDTAATGKLPESGFSYPTPTGLNLVSGTSWRACGEDKGAPAQGRPPVYVETVSQLWLAHHVRTSVHVILRTGTARRTASCRSYQARCGRVNRPSGFFA